MKNDKPQPLTAHLNELRKRALTCLFFLMVFSCLCFAVLDQILDFLKRPAGGSLNGLAVFSPTAAVVSYFKIAAAGGFILSIPPILYQIWMFILPAFESKLRKNGIVFIFSGTFLFLAGACVSYFLILPAALDFLLSIGKNDLVFMISLESYVSFVLLLICGGGLIFEMPLVIFILAKAGVLTAETMVKGWKAAILLILIGAALLTPTPDAVNMLLMAFPMFGLYLVSISVAKFAEGKR